MMQHSVDLSSIRRLAELWRSAKRVVVFSGAGMSTESGLPDFRSSGGLWQQKRRFEQLASLHALQQSPAEFDEFYRWRMRELVKFQPHPGHRALALLQQQGRVQAVITQNVDGFHEQAGSNPVLRLHGTLRAVHCQACGQAESSQRYLEQDRSRCACGGKLRPSVVLFGEALDSATLQAAVAHSAEVDLFVVLGSSLLVSPANSLPKIALQAGAALVIVNRESTAFSGVAALDLRSEIGATLVALAAALER